MSKFLVTGGAGFIGSEVAKNLICNGHEVVVIDNLSTGFLSNVPEDSVFYKINLGKDSLEVLEKHLPFEAIFHIAGQSSGEASFDDPKYDLQANTISTMDLVAFAQKHGIRRFLYASSMSVYGKVGTREAIKETHNSLPISHYGSHKLAAERFLDIHASVNPEFKHTSFRMFNVYGPGQNLENLKQGMISIYLALLERDGFVTVKGDLDRFRDFIHVQDVVKAWTSALANEKTFGQTYNLGTGFLNEVKDVLKELIQTFKNDDDFMKYVKQSGNTPGDVAGVLADMTKFKNDFGFVPTMSLKEGMKTLKEWRKK